MSKVGKKLLELDRKEISLQLEGLEDYRLRELVNNFVENAGRDALKSFKRAIKGRLIKNSSNSWEEYKGTTFTANTRSNLEGLGLMTVEGILNLCHSPTLDLREFFMDIRNSGVKADVARLLTLMGYTRKSKTKHGWNIWVGFGHSSVDAKKAMAMDIVMNYALTSEKTNSFSDLF